MRNFVLLSLTLATVAWSCAGLRPSYIGCLSSEECGKGSCCVIGMGRFTIPQCKAYPDLGEGCRPHGSPVNVSLQYPDGAEVNLTGVYHLFCPCLGELTCEPDTLSDDMPRCMDSFLDNSLDNMDNFDNLHGFHNLDNLDNLDNPDNQDSEY